MNNFLNLLQIRDGPIAQLILRGLRDSATQKKNSDGSHKPIISRLPIDRLICMRIKKLTTDNRESLSRWAVYKNCLHDQFVEINITNPVPTIDDNLTIASFRQ